MTSSRVREGRLPTIVALAVAATTLVVLAGWALHMAPLVRISPYSVPMQVNTALGLLLLSTGLALARRRVTMAAAVLGIAVTGLGAATLAQFLSGRSWGIDTWFGQPFLVTPSWPAGRMSVLSSVSFLVGGVCLATAGTRHRAPLCGVGALVLGAIAIAGLTNGLLDIGTSATFARVGNMAIHTACAFFGCAYLLLDLAWPEREEAWPGWFPFAAGLAVLVLLILLVEVWVVAFPPTSTSLVVFLAAGLSIAMAVLVWFAVAEARRSQVRLIEARQATVHAEALAREVSHSRSQLAAFIEHAPAAVAMFDRDLRYLAWSQRWLREYRLGDIDLRGRHHYDVFPEIGHMPEWQAVHQRALAGEVSESTDDRFVRADGTLEWLRWEVRPWYLSDQRIGGIIMLTEVITARREAARALEESLREKDLLLREKDVLLREIHHRVKNNLAVISSLLSLQGRTSTDPAVRAMVEDGRARIQSMAMVHELLYRSNRVGRIDLADYLRQLGAQLRTGLIGRAGVRVTYDVTPLALDIDRAVPCGLVYCEMFTNAVKHAFTGRESGLVRVGLTSSEGRVALTVEDDGIGLSGRAPQTGRSLGVVLMHTLAQQLDGTCAIEDTGSGTRASLVFPLDER